MVTNTPRHRNGQLVCETLNHRYAVEMQNFKTVQILMIFLQMAMIDTPSPRDADASKKHTVILVI